MKKAFTKNQHVTLISDWDRKGTVTFRHAVVYACGAKRMILTDPETGNEIGRNFRPAVGKLENSLVNGCYYMPGGTFPRMTDEQAIEAGLKVAAAIQQYEREHFARCLAGGHGESYDASIRKGIAELHDLRVIPYSEASAAVRNAVGR